ncbi:SH3 domain-containing protein [Methylobrevis pamukkalensis]|uniref:Bacterial SH3 domain protein n=1 Tax=Methylobrevis pamukkalensis TaxID=1439726 RepID=A0A1E3GWL2_9HYPH|nr:SH3 domain-containing protein [Methylobrevis pamukkalensis]ODN68384.1 Bacterial SH3 domain protein [Methylobrevis pamukkalensis]
MKTRLLAVLALLIGLMVPTTGAFAAFQAYATGNVNLRAGPSTQYPRITTLRVGEPLTVYGCLSGWSWCDVNWRGYRGWVSGRYLEAVYSGRRVIVPNYAPRLGVPVIRFDFDGYWGNHYRRYPFYRDHDRYRYYGRPAHSRPDYRPPRPDRPDYRPPRPDRDRDWYRDRDRDRDRPRADRPDRDRPDRPRPDRNRVELRDRGLPGVVDRSPTKRQQERVCVDNRGREVRCR